MLKSLFLDAGIIKTDQEFKEVMEITTADIKANRTDMGKKTNLIDMFHIAAVSAKVIERCQ